METSLRAIKMGDTKMKEANWKIELWDEENSHVYLATDEEGKVQEFMYHDVADDTARKICNDAYREYDRRFNYFITKTPHKLAVPLT
jgi:hypothetical protein